MSSLSPEQLVPLICTPTLRLMTRQRAHQPVSKKKYPNAGERKRCKNKQKQKHKSLRKTVATSLCHSHSALGLRWYVQPRQLVTERRALCISDIIYLQCCKEHKQQRTQWERKAGAKEWQQRWPIQRCMWRGQKEGRANEAHRGYNGCTLHLRYCRFGVMLLLWWLGEGRWRACVPMRRWCVLRIRLVCFARCVCLRWQHCLTTANVRAVCIIIVVFAELVFGATSAIITNWKFRNLPIAWSPIPTTPQIRLTQSWWDSICDHATCQW